MEAFQDKVTNFQESGSTSSPIWIWFEKTESSNLESICLICKKTMSRKDYSTTCMSNHLKKVHGYISRYNAWKIFEELSCLKATRLKRKHSVTSDDSSQPKQKQMKITESINAAYGNMDPRQKKINNAVASMICVDATPANIVQRPGFSHLMRTVDPRSGLVKAGRDSAVCT
jgi:hypothetical protein